MNKPMKMSEITDFMKNGFCSRCGQCCSNLLPMGDDDVRRIRDYVRRNKIRPAVNGVPLNAAINMFCPFCEMAGKAKCRIYEVRPQICRMFFCGKKPTFEEAIQMEGWTLRNVRETFYEKR